MQCIDANKMPALLRPMLGAAMVLTLAGCSPAEQKDAAAQTQSPPATSAPVATAKAVEIPLSESFDLESKIVKRAYRISIALPKFTMQHPPDSKVAILFMPDADYFFRMVVDSTRVIQELEGRVPPMLVVGIGYTSGKTMTAGILRGADLTPTVDLEFEEFTRRVAPAFGGDPADLQPAGEGSGVAEKFLRFINEELKPELERRYAERYTLDHDNEVYAGVSLGGLFGAYALSAAPESFDRYVIGSPSLWWNKEAMFELEKRYAEGRKDINARVHFAVGALEQGPNEPPNGFRMVDNTRRFMDVLAAHKYPSLRMSMRVVPDESHGSVVAPIFCSGIREVMEHTPPPRPRVPDPSPKPAQDAADKSRNDSE